jgi:ABC-type dipeptide/oligopeptide/nickel transport system ATPase component
LAQGATLLQQIAYPVELTNSVDQHLNNSSAPKYSPTVNGDERENFTEDLRRFSTSATAYTEQSGEDGDTSPIRDNDHSEELPEFTIRRPPETLTAVLGLELLHKVGLTYLAKHFDIENDRRDWSRILSLGEQQRLSVARVLYLRPSIAILDESTSAMDEQNEEQCLGALKRCNIVLLSVAHRSTVKKFHDSALVIDQAGVCKIVGTRT